MTAHCADKLFEQSSLILRDPIILELMQRIPDARPTMCGRHANLE